MSGNVSHKCSIKSKGRCHHFIMCRQHNHQKMRSIITLFWMKKVVIVLIPFLNRWHAPCRKNMEKHPGKLVSFYFIRSIQVVKNFSYNSSFKSCHVFEKKSSSALIFRQLQSFSLELNPFLEHLKPFKVNLFFNNQEQLTQKLSCFWKCMQWFIDLLLCSSHHKTRSLGYGSIFCFMHEIFCSLWEEFDSNMLLKSISSWFAAVSFQSRLPLR